LVDIWQSGKGKINNFKRNKQNEGRFLNMKKYTSKLLILAMFVLLIMVMGQPVYAMGGKQAVSGASGRVQGVPEPLTTLSLLGIGIAGVGAYFLARKKKNK
jgi:LPXTG-motif cell wall-anchored protein